MITTGKWDAKFTPESIAAFRRVCEETVATTHKTMPQVVLWGAKFFVVSARKATPLCTAPGLRREVRANPDYQQLRLFGGRMGQHPWQVKVWYQEGDPYKWVTVTPENERTAYQIKYAGTAWNSWNGAYQKLAKTGQVRQRGRGGRLSNAQKFLNGETPSVVLTNRVSYMEKIRPHILQESLEKTVRSFEHQLSRQAIKAWREQWKVSA